MATHDLTQDRDFRERSGLRLSSVGWVPRQVFTILPISGNNEAPRMSVD